MKGGTRAQQRGEGLKSRTIGIALNVKANTPKFGLVKTPRPAKRSTPLLPIIIGMKRGAFKKKLKKNKLASLNDIASLE
ncbi:hypothetical protein [Sinomicrobium sp. M5D2P17]